MHALTHHTLPFHTKAALIQHSPYPADDHHHQQYHYHFVARVVVDHVVDHQLACQQAFVDHAFVDRYVHPGNGR